MIRHQYNISHSGGVRAYYRGVDIATVPCAGTRVGLVANMYPSGGAYPQNEDDNALKLTCRIWLVGDIADAGAKSQESRSGLVYSIPAAVDEITGDDDANFTDKKFINIAQNPIIVQDGSPRAYSGGHTQATLGDDTFPPHSAALACKNWAVIVESSWGAVKAAGANVLENHAPINLEVWSAVL